MNRILSLFIIFIFCTSLSISQTSGYLGKRNLIGFNLIGSIPLTYNLFVLNSSTAYGQYKVENGKFEEASNLFSSGFSFSASRVLKNRFALGLEFRSVNYKTLMPYSINIRKQNSQFAFSGELLRAPYLKVNDITFSPYVEWTKEGGLLPIGLVHQLGINIHSLSLENPKSDFLMRYQYFDENSNYTMEQSNETPLDIDQINLLAFGVNYKLQLRVPINEYLLFHVGVRYQMNIFMSQNYTGFDWLYTTNGTYEGKDVTFFSSDEIMFNIRRSYRLNIAQIESGISFAF
ncbi:MAG: hypothetical protein KJ941_06880 [Bacteroidetes bacterium]|nr:hypothetical protein [Bacteroidota bacterium]